MIVKYVPCANSTAEDECGKCYYQWCPLYQTKDGRGGRMTRENALEALKQMYQDIDKNNWLFVGTINPEMIMWAIRALDEVEE